MKEEIPVILGYIEKLTNKERVEILDNLRVRWCEYCGRAEVARTMCECQR